MPPSTSAPLRRQAGGAKPFPATEVGPAEHSQPIPSTDFAVVQSSSIAVCAADRVTWWAHTAFLTAFLTESLP